MVGLDSNHFYQTQTREYIKVLENDIILCETTLHNKENIAHFSYKILTPELDLYQLHPNKILFPKFNTASSIHLIIL